MHINNILIETLNGENVKWPRFCLSGLQPIIITFKSKWRSATIHMPLSQEKLLMTSVSDDQKINNKNSAIQSTEIWLNCNRKKSACPSWLARGFRSAPLPTNKRCGSETRDLGRFCMAKLCHLVNFPVLSVIIQLTVWYSFILWLIHISNIRKPIRIIYVTE